MRDKRRSIKTKFWEDSFIEELTPSFKLLYLYLLTNPMTNLIGIYEISKRRIKFDTGLDDKTISNGFEWFANHKKAYFLDENYVILPNWLKNQDFNKNMLIGAKSELQSLPKSLIDKVLGDDSERLINDSKWLPNGSLSFENIEIEVEEEIECEKYIYSKFYDKQLSESNDDTYKEFVEFLFGKNDLKRKLTKVLSMKDQIRHDRFNELIQLCSENGKKIRNVIIDMETKKYKYDSFNGALTNWIKR